MHKFYSYSYMTLTMPTRSLALTALTLAVSVIGCASSSTSPDYIASYNSGRSASAYRDASIAASKEVGADRERAALVAGLAAHALGNTAHAAAWLSPLLTSRDDSIAGRAGAAMGLIAQQRGDHERAAELLTASSLKLTGEDAAKAAYFASESFAAIGRRDQADLQRLRALALTKDPHLKNVLTSPASAGMFTIQLGAFSDRSNANRAAREQTAAAARMRLGTPRVVARTDRAGRMLYLVQVGSFSSLAKAKSASQKLGNGAIVVKTSTPK